LWLLGAEHEDLRAKQHMKNTNRTIIVTAAIAGLLGGAAIQRGYAADNDAKPGKEAPAKKSPKVQDCSGNNDCKGLGGCKTGDNGCKFKNSCKGKGGCHITKKDIKDWKAKNKKA
jgi:hypothetical protein